MTSNYHESLEEVHYIKHHFLNREYPEDLIDKMVEGVVKGWGNKF